MVALKGFNVRDDEAVRYAIRRSNIVVNCIGAERETWNYDFEEVHVDIAARIAEACAANPIVERLMHVSCLSASADAPSKRLRTKARAPCLPTPVSNVGVAGLALNVRRVPA